MNPDDVEEMADYAEEQAERAVEATSNANPEIELEEIDDLYAMMMGVDDAPTYTLELTLHEYEVMQLVGGMMDGIDRMQNADELAFKSAMLAKILRACPEHLERLDELKDEMDQPRGFA